MKKLTLLLLLITQYGFAAPFKLTGKVEKPIRNYVVFQNHEVFSGLVRKDTIFLKNGNFSYSINANHDHFSNVYIFVDSERQLEVIGYPNYQLRIDFLLAPSKPLITGSMAKIQKFADYDNVYWAKIYSAYEKRNPNFKKKEFLRTDFYFKIQDSITQDRINNLITFFKNKKSAIETAFINYRKNGFIYSDLYYKQSYPNPPYEKFKFYQTNFKIKANHTYSYSESVDFNTPNLIYNSSYTRFMNSFFLSELQKRREKYSIPFSFKTIIGYAFPLIDELSTNPIANYQLKLAFSAYLTDDVERSKQAKETQELLSALQNSGIKKSPELQNLYSRLTKLVKFNKFKKGSIAPDFTLLDTLNSEIKLTDLKGKRIIIDVAASWCGPCIAGIPAWNKMVSENKDTETVFIFLSLDNTMTESLILFNKHKPMGQLLFAGNGGFASEFAKTYEISILPNKIVIDKEGKIESYYY